MPHQVDLNSDLGEGFGIWRLGDDQALLDIVTSANVACGFHGGDPTIMRTVCEHAGASGVAIGAHVGYRDLIGFGRRPMEMDPDVLRDDVLYQLGALDAVARHAGSRVGYVKPHGALYNRIVRDADQATAVVDAVRSFDAGLPILGLPGSVVLEQATAAGLPTVTEAFADRAYQADGQLVPRSQPGAVITDSEAVAERCVKMATENVVDSIDGTSVSTRPRSLCVHGDTPGAVDLARRIRAALIEAGVELTPFATTPATLSS